MSNVKKSVAERIRHQRQYDRRWSQKAVGQKTASRKTSMQVRNGCKAHNADIKPVYDEEPMANVQLAAECNVTATRQHHTEQLEIINEGRVYQYTKNFQVKSHILDSSLDNKTTEFSN
ncbi:hypothetical protein Tco_0451867 [Tanacetum coccineum]